MALLSRRPRLSLRWQLTLMVALLTAIGVTLFVGIAYRDVQRNLLRAAEARAEDAADRLASLFAQSTAQRIFELQRAAEDESLRRFLERPTDASRAEALRALAGSLPRNGGQGAQTVEVWTMAGACALVLTTPGEADAQTSCGSQPARAGIAPLRRHSGALYGESTTAIAARRAAGDSSVSGPVLGYLVVRRPVGVGPNADVLNGLIGSGAAIAVGNASGDAWTDFVRPIPPPPIDLGRPGVASYRDADGDEHLGALADIRGTPWAVWIAFPRALVLSPARAFLRRIAGIAAAFTSVAVVIIWVFAGRIAAPLNALTVASEAITKGDYSRRVSICGPDEVGRLGLAFNTMADRVATARQDLEARVVQRTARLEEAGRLLEQHARESREARDELDRFFSLSLDLLCIADTSGRFVRVNPEWERVLGWTAAELTSAPYETFVHPDDRASTAAETMKLASGGIVISFQNRYRHRDGSYRWLSWKAASHLERGLVYAAARDVTDDMLIARERDQHVDALAAVNQELEAFSYSVSHDLRAPLRHITGFATLLTRSAEGTLDGEGRRYLRVIVEAAVRMGHLIDDLLAFSRVGRTPLTHASVDLNPLVREAREEVMADARDRTIRWTIDDLPSVRGDATLLRIMLVNLLANAVKYTSTRPAAEIEVAVAAIKDDETTVFVRDNGVGFDMTYGDKLFGVFQRLHSSDEFEGTGIGLATVRRIVQRHGGRVWAESQVDAGATFYVSLPVFLETREP